MDNEMPPNENETRYTCIDCGTEVTPTDTVQDCPNPDCIRNHPKETNS